MQSFEFTSGIYRAHDREKVLCHLETHTVRAGTKVWHQNIENSL